MPLDWVELASQIEVLASRLKSGEEEREKRRELAWDLMRSQAGKLESLQRKISGSKTTWLVAGLSEELCRCYKSPLCPSEFSVVAVDGSHIDVDRHSPVPCYLINLGSALLHYGENPDASLLSSSALYFGDEDLAIVDPGSSHEEPVERALLGVKRGVEECRQLAELMERLPQERTTLALLDGSLILWGLAGKDFPEFVREALLEDGFLGCLDRLKRLSSGKKLAMASYISFPRSTEVVNALRLSLCPHEPADCDRYCPGRPSARRRECEAMAGIQDREVFDALLTAGERSATFFSRSSIVQKHYREHQVFFFYLKIGEEIARVELPQWIAQERSLLDLVHALVLDQCCRGLGYPVALSEAHEKAVIREADREQFWYLVEWSLRGRRLPVQSSAKSRSKRTRWV